MPTNDRSLVLWMENPPPNRGLHFAEAGDKWNFWSYESLARLSLRASAAYRQRGLGVGSLVAVIQRSSPAFAASMFGAFSAGVTACSMAPPFAMQRRDDYTRHLAHLLSASRPDLVVCDDESAGAVRGPLAALQLAPPVVFDELIGGVDPTNQGTEPSGTALIQFTSGSSGASRGVRVSAAALRANLEAMRHWLNWDASQPGITWLPVHHDMGLVGCLLNFVVTGCDGYLMQPDDFIRSPIRFLTCISDNKVALTAMPNFGLAYIVRRIRPADLRDLRFDSLRSVIVGAERTDCRVLRRFEELFGPHGLDRRALLPAYGSAEATLAVTGLPPRTGWRTAAPQATGASGIGAQSVSCGRPLRGITVAIVDESGEKLPEGQVGEIVVTGASVATEYASAQGVESQSRIKGQTLFSGDAGFLADGELFVIGRLGDGLKVRGRMVFAESLELALSERGVPERRVAVLLGIRDGRATGVVVLENEQDGWAAIAADVLGEALDNAELIAVNVPRGGLAVTSSGKPRRRVMWQAFLDFRLPGETRPLSAPEAPCAGGRTWREPTTTAPR